VGIGGLAAALRESLRDIRFGRADGNARARYLIERQDAAASVEPRYERVPAAAGATLLGLHDFVRMLPELSARRAQLQARRKRSDEEIFARFGGRWTAAVPSIRGDLHAALRAQVMDVLRP
jgi:hypothetical protein